MQEPIRPGVRVSEYRTPVPSGRVSYRRIAPREAAVKGGDIERGPQPNAGRESRGTISG
jgi:hypothetical protein